MAFFVKNDNFYWHKYDIKNFGINYIRSKLHKYKIEFDVENTTFKINEWKKQLRLIYNFTIKIDGEKLIVDEYLEEDDYPSFEIYNDFTKVLKELEREAIETFEKNPEDLYAGKNEEERKDNAGKFYAKYFTSIDRNSLKNYLFEKNYIEKYCKEIRFFSEKKIITEFFTYENIENMDEEVSGEIIINNKKAKFCYEFTEAAGGCEFEITCDFDKNIMAEKIFVIFFNDLLKRLCEKFNFFYRD